MFALTQCVPVVMTMLLSFVFLICLSTTATTTTAFQMLQRWTVQPTTAPPFLLPRPIMTGLVPNRQKYKFTKHSNCQSIPFLSTQLHMLVDEQNDNNTNNDNTNNNNKTIVAKNATKIIQTINSQEEQIISSNSTSLNDIGRNQKETSKRQFSFGWYV